MPNFLKYFDKGRIPRDVQVLALNQLSEDWHKYDMFCLSMPVGSGKSLISRAIQRAEGGAIITPSNVLVKQYADEFKDLNHFWGRTHYMCHTYKTMTCQDVHELLRQNEDTTKKYKVCKECKYSEARKAAIAGVPTIFNPMSYYFLKVANKDFSPKVLIIDEAHSLTDMLMLLTEKSFNTEKYRVPKDTNNMFLVVEWLNTVIITMENYLNELIKKREFKSISKARDALQTTMLLRQQLMESPEAYSVYTEKKKTWKGMVDYLVIRPYKLPQSLVRRFFDGVDKVVLLSGTILHSDIEELTQGKPSKYYDLPSPIPKENRPILFRPFKCDINYQTPPEVYANAIKGLWAKISPQSCIVHLPYSLITKIEPYLKDIDYLTNTKDDKQDIVAKFKEKGGLFIAGGCAEGIDLKYDMARYNIVLKLSFPNLGDPTVKRRLAAPGGNRNYELTTLRHVIQASGRSTRAEDDFSTTIVCDPAFARIVSTNRDYLPKYFLESIVWNK